MTLSSLLLSYSDSLTRTEAERDHRKTLIARAEFECRIAPAAFKRAALAYHQDKIADVIEDLEAQLSALELVKGAGEQTE